MGECKRTPKPNDTEVHCFDGFKCLHCGQLLSFHEMSGTDNVCDNCEEHYHFDKIKENTLNVR